MKIEHEAEEACPARQGRMKTVVMSSNEEQEVYHTQQAPNHVRCTIGNRLVGIGARKVAMCVPIGADLEGQEHLTALREPYSPMGEATTSIKRAK